MDKQDDNESKKKIEKHALIDSIFGEEIGGLIKIGILMLVVFLMMFGPMWFSRQMQKATSNTQEEIYIKQLKELPPDTQSLINEIIEVNNHTQEILKRLEKDASESEKLVQEKKEALDILQKQNEMLKLTPDQLQVIDNYNRVVNKAPSSFNEWLVQKTVWYDKLLGIALSIVGFIIGRWYQGGKKKNNDTSETTE